MRSSTHAVNLSIADTDTRAVIDDLQGDDDSNNSSSNNGRSTLLPARVSKDFDLYCQLPAGHKPPAIADSATLGMLFFFIILTASVFWMSSQFEDLPDDE